MAASAVTCWGRSRTHCGRPGREEPAEAAVLGGDLGDEPRVLAHRLDLAGVAHDAFVGYAPSKVITLIIDGDRCLLGRQAAWPPGMYSAIAGFVEPGETIEAAVRREAEEETGIAVGEVRYLSSQPWPFPASLMLGFHAYADPAQPIQVDPEEISEARWFTRDDIAKMITGGYTDASGVRFTLPMASSIAFYLIERWLGGLAR